MRRGRREEEDHPGTRGCPRSPGCRTKRHKSAKMLQGPGGKSPRLGLSATGAGFPGGRFLLTWVFLENVDLRRA